VPDQQAGGNVPEIKGPAVSAEAFRVEGHCCGIRLPALQDLTGKGIEFELSPETKAELIAQGMLPSEDPRADEEKRGPAAAR
jgi:hypothetical protein